MPKTNQQVTWASAASTTIGPGARAESDVMAMDAAAWDAAVELRVTGNGSGAETGYQVEFYAVYANAAGVFENTPPKSRMQPLGAVTIDVTTFPLILPARHLQPVPAEYKIVAISGAATDTVTVEAVARIVT